ncbi:MAG: acyltransferase [Chlorobium sp.]|nr:acyltransferase [Chlorobium sp.]
MKYRADIDGLRAIAVLSVIFFHLGIPGFSGGFVGVDVFFVISGYLITSIILKDIQSGQFSITRFYERRIRRIFPALFPVILFTLFVATFLFDPISFKDFGNTITSTTLFASNILFWHRSGYFDLTSLQRPLLHTWSLAVEEQFYIFFNRNQSVFKEPILPLDLRNRCSLSTNKYLWGLYKSSSNILSCSYSSMGTSFRVTFIPWSYT